MDARSDPPYRNLPVATGRGRMPVSGANRIKKSEGGRVDKRNASTGRGRRWMRFTYPPYPTTGGGTPGGTAGRQAQAGRGSGNKIFFLLCAPGRT